MSKTINDYADSMLEKINLCVQDAIKSTPILRGAVVSNVNQNGTVDIYFPPNDTVVFTNISNQTPFELYTGDSVEILVKGGNYSNCWVVAKHQSTYSVNDIREDFQTLQTQLTTLQAQYVALEARVTALEP